MSPRTITYPPEMLPKPDEDDEVAVIVVEPTTGEEIVVWTE